MKNKKKYPFDTKEDFIKCFYLVAEYAIRYFYRYQEVLMNYEKDIILNAKQILLKSMVETNCILEGDLENLIEELKKEKYKTLVQLSSQKLDLKYNKFKDYEERLAYNYGVLLNTFGDSAGASYRRIRSEYDKKKNELDLPQLTDSTEIDKVLNLCLKSRNYAHHFSEPKLLTWRKYREEQVKNNPSIIWPPLDIEITRCNITNIIFVLEIYKNYSNFFDVFNVLQFCIRNDYCILASGKGCNGDVQFKMLNKVDDYSALIVSRQGGNLYSE